jgi:hypothetical protein
MWENGMDHHVRGSAGQPARLDTELIDLTEYSLGDTLDVPEHQFAPYLNRTILQVERPRTNLGRSGPPGRVD